MGRLLLVTAGVLWIAGCGSLPGVRSDYTSVDAVLQRTAFMGEQLDREEKLRQKSREPASRLKPGFQPPLKFVKVNSGFGKRRGQRHEGWDLQASEGTPIYAAERGIVAFAGSNIDGYGDTVIVRHVGGYSTLYAHASVLGVQVGDLVTKGQCLGYTGQTGKASGPHLHFEVRDGMRAVNPATWFSPKRKVANQR